MAGYKQPIGKKPAPAVDADEPVVETESEAEPAVTSEIEHVSFRVSELDFSVPELAAALALAIKDARAKGQIVTMPFRLEDLARIAVSDTAKSV